MKELTLTEDQERATQGILSDIRKPKARPVLCGYAGTGKTVTTAALVARLYGQGLKVIVATPTHKARFQVERALHNHGIFTFQTSTVHKLLGLKAVRNYETGVETFEPDLKGNSTKSILNSIDIVIVDETSMVNSDLYQMLIKEMEDKPIVFVGDDQQLLPVGEDQVCKAFTDATSTYRLTEVLRHDGAILTLATSIRETTEGRSPFYSNEGGGSKVVAYSSHGRWIKEMLEIMSSDESLQDPDHCRVLAWTNKSVNQINDIIHKRRYGDSAPQYVEGMSCVTVDAVADPNGGSPLLNSTVDVHVLSAVQQSIKLPGDDLTDPPWSTWLLMVKVDDTEVEIRAMDRLEMRRWKGAQGELAARAKKSNRRSDLWKTFYRRRDMIAKLEPSSALTIHKSQGSTFQNVFLHRDIDYDTCLDSQKRLAYVGVTRASVALHVVED